MRRAPPSEFLVSRFGWWRGAIVAAAAASALALGAWGWLERDPARTLPAVLLGIATIAAAIVTAFQSRPVRLRWDGEHWYAPAEGAGDASAAAHRLIVAVDLGPWMLLCLRPVPSAPAARTLWIPIQRRGHEAQWHGMRRAVYFPRPSVGGPPVPEPQTHE
jgi:hypothetical protein